MVVFVVVFLFFLLLPVFGLKPVKELDFLHLLGLGLY